MDPDLADRIRRWMDDALEWEAAQPARNVYLTRGTSLMVEATELIGALIDHVTNPNESDQP